MYRNPQTYYKSRNDQISEAFPKPLEAGQVKMPFCPVCNRLTLKFLIDTDEPVPYCSVCRYKLRFVYRAELVEPGETIFTVCLLPIPIEAESKEEEGPRREENESSPLQTQTPTNARPEHKGVLGLVYTYFVQRCGTHVQTKQLKQEIDASGVSINHALNKLRAKKKIRKVAHGVYKLVV